MTMTAAIDNRGEKDYTAKIRAIADTLASWDGPIVIISHVDPDGDALGSTLTLKRALEALGRSAILPLDPPGFLRFLAEPGELSAPLPALPEHCLLAVLDVEVGERATGAPIDQAEFVINIDHHGTNTRLGDLSCVQPGRAATAHIIKDLVDALGVTWTPEIATPCLTGILTDTGNFRFANTTPEVLEAAGELIAEGVAYSDLTDRLQWRNPSYFVMLGKVMSTVEFPLDGRMVMAHLSQQMVNEVGQTEDDSDDFVGVIRYAEGSLVAVFLKEREDHTKISVRTRGGISAQAICVRLGGGGHPAAAGAKVHAGLEETRRRVIESAAQELREGGYEVS
ncbi:MAG TPA: DHH family phosphoesterase [Trueperaceae bacterium]